MSGPTRLARWCAAGSRGAREQRGAVLARKLALLPPLAALALCLALTALAAAPRAAVAEDETPTSVTIDGNGGSVPPGAATGLYTALPASGERPGYRLVGYRGVPESGGEAILAALPGDLVWKALWRLGHVDVPAHGSLADYTLEELRLVSKHLSALYDATGHPADPAEPEYDPAYLGDPVYQRFSRFLEDGTTMDFALNNGAGTMRVRLVGINHDTLAEKKEGYGSRAGLTFMMTHRLGDSYKLAMNTSNTNSGGWDGSNMRKVLLGNVTQDDSSTVWNLLPEELRGALVRVEKRASEGNQSKTIKTSSDLLWLPSAVEVGLAGTDSTLLGEGTTYAWWASHDTGDDRGALTYAYGTTTPYYVWLRSPYPPGTNAFQSVIGGGSLVYDYVLTSIGVVLGFSL